MIYEVVIGESASLAKDRWLIQAKSLRSAVEKAEQKCKSNKELYHGWVVVIAKEVGELSI